MVKIAELSTTAYVRAQRKALIHIVAPGDNASHVELKESLPAVSD